jgi:hypothetical protein
MSKVSYCLLLLCLLLASCAPPAQQVIIIPTLAELPSVTPPPTDTPTPTVVPSATSVPSPTLNLVETQVAVLQATNAVALMTLDVLKTQMAPSSTPTFTLTPNPTLTNMPITSEAPLVVPMEPRLIYAQSVANLRGCPNRTCEPLAQLQTGEAVMATGTIQGEALTSGNPHWFRVDYGGQALYIYSELVNVIPPTQPPVSVPPTNVSVQIEQPPISEPPISLPPQGGGSCPSLSATCSQLTCDQAYACLAAGNSRLDGDGDGVPCESICS